MYMKTGMNLLLWTDHVTEAQDVIGDQIKVLGFDAVEVPVFATSDLAPYQRLGKRLKILGLGATAVTVMGQETNPISSDRDRLLQRDGDACSWGGGISDDRRHRGMERRARPASAPGPDAPF